MIIHFFFFLFFKPPPRPIYFFPSQPQTKCTDTFFSPPPHFLHFSSCLISWSFTWSFPALSHLDKPWNIKQLHLASSCWHLSACMGVCACVSVVSPDALMIYCRVLWLLLCEVKFGTEHMTWTLILDSSFFSGREKEKTKWVSSERFFNRKYEEHRRYFLKRQKGTAKPRDTTIHDKVVSRGVWGL